MTDRYAVIGNPIAHSQSPFIHQCFALQTGQALLYERLHCPLDGFAAALQKAIQPCSEDYLLRGCSVTLPFKFQAFDLAHHRTERAVLAQAANTLRFDAGGCWADNTDGMGLVRDIQHNAAVPLAQQRVLMIGAGGAAAGALGALLEARPAELVLANRSVDKALSLVARHQVWAHAHGVQLTAGGLDDCGEGFDVVINASSSSLSGSKVPVSQATLRPGGLALDMMYGTAAQGFMAWAELHGARARDGLGMLVEQAAQAFALWRGVVPQTAPVLQALRERLQSQ
jgi:shikimate dehydrogenase